MLGLPGQSSCSAHVPQQMVVKTLKCFSNGWQPTSALPPDLLGLPPHTHTQSNNYKINVWPRREPWDPCSGSAINVLFVPAGKCLEHVPVSRVGGSEGEVEAEARLVYYSG